MDLLSQHEAFLRAIFDAPDDDTPRLVYADFLQENGENDRAEFIRVQCELTARGDHWDEKCNALQVREWELLNRLQPERQFREPHEREQVQHVRGFSPAASTLVIDSAMLNDPLATRWRIALHEPETFGARTLAVAPGVLLRPEHFEMLFALPVAQQVTEWDLGGYVEDLATAPFVDQIGDFEFLPRMTGFQIAPAVTTTAVNLLTRHRSARKLTSLILTNNDLDNDAARALVKSPYLDNLKRLQLLEGNRLRGKVWQQVIERFGEDVVG
jgi:uncharacterized protein (TIGR02996 family)